MDRKLNNRSIFSTHAHKITGVEPKAIETEELQKSVAKDLERSKKGKEKYEAAQAARVKAKLEEETVKEEDKNESNK